MQIRTLLVLLLAAAAMAGGETRQLTRQDYFDKVHGGWTGKALGLAMGVAKESWEPWPPSKFEYFAEVPTHFSDRQSGDDVYVPLVLQLALKKYGLHPTQEQYLNEWSERLFTGKIWVSCEVALDHFRAGLKPPKTGQPGFNRYWDDMCSQMSTDVIGWIAPGMLQTAAKMGDHASHVINWGSGADGGVFTAAIDSEAFFTRDPAELVRRARRVLPAGSAYRKMIDYLLDLRSREPDWRVARQSLAQYLKSASSLNISPEPFAGMINGGGVLIAVLYGDGDFGKSLLIAQKCGWDSDTNAATAGGILGTMLGLSHMEPRWRLVLHDTYENYCVRGLPRWMRFSDIAADTVALGEKAIRENGGSVSNGVYTIPIQAAAPLPRQEHLTTELLKQNQSEMAQFYREKLNGITAMWQPEWTLTMAAFENPSGSSAGILRPPERTQGGAQCVRSGAGADRGARRRQAPLPSGRRGESSGHPRRSHGPAHQRRLAPGGERGWQTRGSLRCGHPRRHRGVGRPRVRSHRLGGQDGEGHPHRS